MIDSVLKYCWRKTSREEKLLLVFFLCSLPLVNPYLRGDGNGYYAYIRSVVIDKDLNFENEYRHGDPAFLHNHFDDKGNLWARWRLPNGYVTNKYAVGPSLLWSPFFISTHLILRFLNSLGWSFPLDGYAYPYRLLCALGTAFYSFLGLWLAFLLAKHFVEPGVALLATLALWLASPLPVYTYWLPFYSHALSAFAVALFLWYGFFHISQDASWRSWAIWGLMTGLMMDMYYLNAVIGIVAFVRWVKIWRRENNQQRMLLHGVVFSLAGVIALSPHLWTRWRLYGSPLATGYSESWFFTEPRLWQLGFSAEHGMFLWTPVLLLAVIGLGLLWRHDRCLAAGLILAFACLYYVLASFENWHGQSSFGSRFFISFTPAFVLGLAVFLEAGRAILPRKLMLASLSVLSLWNIGFVFQWGAGLIPHRGPVDFSVMAGNQFTAVPQRMGRFLLRYFTSRANLVADIERKDLEQLKSYRQHR